MLLYRCFVSLISLLNFKAWEKVWVNPALLGHGQSQYLRVGDKVFDNKGRLCIVEKQGKNGSLRRLSHAKTEDTVAGWSFKKLGWMYGKFMQSRRFVLKRAMLLGPSLRYRWMTFKFRCVIWVFRTKRQWRSLRSWDLDALVLWWFIILPLACGIILSLAGDQ